MGSCISGGGQYHTRFLVLGEGKDKGETIFKYFNVDLFTLSININI